MSRWITTTVMPAFLILAALAALVGAASSPAAAAAPWFADSFEGPPPHGWSPLWFFWGNNITTDEVAPPPGGGRYTYRQIWNGGQGWSGLTLTFADVPGMPAKFGTGSEFYFHYFIKYDPNFNWGSTTGFKHIIVQSDASVNDRLYICLWGTEGTVWAYVQNSQPDVVRYSNVNNGTGGNYRMPKGQWVEFLWYVKVSPQTESKGLLKGWVNGTLRWDYSNIVTVRAGNYVTLDINPTFNQGIDGPNQKRYWDLFYISSAPIPAPVAEAGPDSTAYESRTCSLDGSASTNANTYAWIQKAGKTVTLQNPNTAKPSFVVPKPASKTEAQLQFQLTVANSSGSSSDSVNYRIRLLGDANGDDCVDSADRRIWLLNYDPLGVNQNSFEMGDFNGDGKIDSADRRIWLLNYNPLGLPSN